MYKKLQKTYKSMLEDDNKMFWASLTDLAVSFHPSSPTLLAEDRKIQKNSDLSIQKTRFKLSWYFHKNSTFLHVPEHSFCPDVQSEILIMVLPFCLLWKLIFNIRDGCLSWVDCVLNCHMLIVCYMSALVINNFYSNFVPVKHDQPRNIILCWSVALI